MNNKNVALRPARATHKVTNSLITKGISVFMPNSQGIAIRDDARSSLSITNVLTTSDDSCVRTSVSEVKEIQSDDIPGPITIGTVIEEKVNEEVSKVAVYSSGYLLNDTCNTIVSGANYELVLNTITWMGEIEDKEVIIDGKKQVRKICEWGMNFDERIADGYYFAKSADLLQYLLSHPEELEKPASDKIDMEEIR